VIQIETCELAPHSPIIVDAAAAPAPACQEKRHLDRVYEVAVGDYGRALDLLESGIVMDGPEYDRLRQYIEEARLLSELARQALDRHIEGHGC